MPLQCDTTSFLPNPKSNHTGILVVNLSKAICNIISPSSNLKSLLPGIYTYIVCIYQFKYFFGNIKPYCLIYHTFQLLSTWICQYKPFIKNFIAVYIECNISLINLLAKKLKPVSSAWMNYSLVLWVLFCYRTDCTNSKYKRPRTLIWWLWF